jgi:hypothetical protein
MFQLKVTHLKLIQLLLHVSYVLYQSKIIMWLMRNNFKYLTNSSRKLSGFGDEVFQELYLIWVLVQYINLFYQFCYVGLIYTV